MYWRNMKLKIMIALIVIAGLMYVMVPIIIQVSAKWLLFIFKIKFLMAYVLNFNP